MARTPRTTMTAMAQWGKLESDPLCKLPGVAEELFDEAGELALILEEAAAAETEDTDAADLDATEADDTDARDADTTEALEAEDTEAIEDTTESAKVVSGTWSEMKRSANGDADGGTYGLR